MRKLVVCLVLCLWAATTLADSCSLHAAAEDAFQQGILTQPGSEDAGPCRAFSGNSCCTADYAQLIAADTDPIGARLSAALHVDAAAAGAASCSALLRGLQCLACSPMQGHWLQVLPYETDLTLCSGYCDALLASCGPVAHLAGQEGRDGALLNTLFQPGEGPQLCRWLFDQWWHVSIGNTQDCYDPSIRQCTEDDILARYSDCDYSTYAAGRRNAYYFWKQGVKCQGGVHLPEPVYGLSCSIPCGQGQYLPIGATECASCAEGTMSVGGGVRVNEWSEWPARDVLFHTYCENAWSGILIEDCPGWTLNGSFISSGPLEYGQKSVLELSVNFVKAGEVAFRWSVDGEVGWDEFSFAMDRQELIHDKAISSPTVSSFEVSPGLHHFQWSFKRISNHNAEYAATLEWVQLLGLSWSTSQCTRCPPGTSSRSGSSICHPCEDFTYNPDWAGTCRPCPDDQYSLSGASECLDRVPCTTDDYVGLWSHCAAASAGPSRTLTYHWKQPHICDHSALPLPTPVDGPCAPCNPGFRRVGDSPECVACPAGEYLPDGGDTCLTCGAGNYAPPTHYYTSWDEWPDHVTTGCDGIGCDFRYGWRLLDDSIDSGIGHGKDAEPWFSVSVFLPNDGSVTFEWAMVCGVQYPGWCEMQWSDGEEQQHTLTWGGTRSFPLTAGYKTLTWRFRMREAHRGDIASSRLIIKSIKIVGAGDGSAHECLPCDAGSAAPAGSITCSTCPAGTSAARGSSVCDGCSGDTFTDLPGQSRCMVCGQGTTANADHTDCQTDCSWTTGTGTTYNLTALSRPEMWGPVIDVNDFSYFLSICDKEHRTTHHCLDANGNPVTSYACQIIGDGTGLDIGDRLAFDRLPDGRPEAEGLVLRYSGGSTEWACPVPRQVELQMLCDPSKGMGQPKGPLAGAPVESPPCHYSFHWASAYACPLCAEGDWGQRAGPCDNGQQRIEFYWLDRPKRCLGSEYGGRDLPQPHSISCSAGSVCPAGQYWATAEAACVPAPPGHFSIGDGQEFDDWAESSGSLEDKGFAISCQADPLNPKSCTQWSQQEYQVDSGTGTSSLSLERNFARADRAEVLFTYKLFTPGPGRGALLELLLDDNRVIFSVDTPSPWWRTARVPLHVTGSYRLTWRFVGGQAPYPGVRAGVGAALKSLVVLGTNRVAYTPEACAPGTYQPGSGASECLPCPAGAYCPAGSTRPTPCAQGQWAPAGSDQCEPRPKCDRDLHFQDHYGPCQPTGQRVHYWLPLQPFVCYDAPHLPNTTVACGGCPPHLVADSSNGGCVACAQGRAPMGAQCAIAPPGNAAVRVSAFLWDHGEARWPGSWSTNCSGTCGSDGWRLRGDRIDSGWHEDQEVDSWVSTDVELDKPGSVTFVWNADGLDRRHRRTRLDAAQHARRASGSGLDFYVDNVRQALGVATAEQELSFELSPGQHQLTWVYRQVLGSQGYVSLRAIMIKGVAPQANPGPDMGSLLAPCPPGSQQSAPGSDYCTPCPAGYYSEREATECLACRPGTYSWRQGSASCTGCGAGSWSGPGATQCVNNCTWTDANGSGRSWDLTALRDATPSPVPDHGVQGRLYRMSLCDPLPANACPGAEGPVHVCETVPTDAAAGGAGGSSVNAGRTPSMSVDEEDRLVLTFDDGDAGDCGRGSQPGVARTSSIIFECANDASDELLYFSRVGGAAGGCGRVFTWRTRSGCRVCEQGKDYLVEVGDCEGGKATLLLKRNSTDCNGPAIIQQQQVQCDSGYTFPMALLIVGGLAFVMLVGVIVYILLRNRSLMVKYHHLSADQDGSFSDAQGPEMYDGGEEDYGVARDDEPVDIGEQRDARETGIGAGEDDDSLPADDVGGGGTGDEREYDDDDL